MAERPFVWQMIKEAMDNIGDKATYADIKHYIHNKYENVNDSTITCQIIVCTVNHNTRIYYPENSKPRVANSQYDLLYTVGRGQIERYDPKKHGIWEIKKDETGKLTVSRKDGLGEVESDFDTTLEIQDKYSFPLESHLRDFIAQNLNTIKIDNKNLKLYADDNGTDGVEYRTNVGIIDILATDEDDNYVIFELKLSRGNDASLGQILRYMGWIKKNMAIEKKVYGVIVAQSIDDKLKYAVSQVANIRLYEYQIDFHINFVSI